MTNFASKLKAVSDEHGPLCVGIDPAEQILSDWGMADSAEAARDFGYEIISACEGRVGIIKPQVAFYERFGSAGFVALEETMEAAREAGLMVIADAKRGDIGSTMRGYAQAWFGDDSPLRCDALTLSPFLGPTSLEETIETARDVAAGVFLLAATSNPEAAELQQAVGGGKTVSERVLSFAAKNRSGDVGVVIGATAELKTFGIESIRNHDAGVPILAPGFGAQGARLSELSEIFGASSHRVLPNVSREVYAMGPSALMSQLERLKSQL